VYGAFGPNSQRLARANPTSVSARMPSGSGNAEKPEKARTAGVQTWVNPGGDCQFVAVQKREFETKVDA
jgi:hypothetical protein